MIGQRIEPTLSLMIVTLILSIAVAVPMGVVAAWKAGTWIDRAGHGASRCSASRCRCSWSATCWPMSSRSQLEWLPVQGYTPLAEGLLALAART